MKTRPVLLVTTDFSTICEGCKAAEESGKILHVACNEYQAHGFVANIHGPISESIILGDRWQPSTFSGDVGGPGGGGGVGVRGEG